MERLSVITLADCVAWVADYMVCESAVKASSTSHERCVELKAIRWVSPTARCVVAGHCVWYESCTMTAGKRDHAWCVLSGDVRRGSRTSQWTFRPTVPLWTV